MMNLRETIRNRKGAAIEWVIVFGLVIFALMSLLTSIMLFSTHYTKTVMKQQQKQIKLNQIGEYFIRSAESNGDFPTGYIGNDKTTVQTDFSAYTWMGDEAREFFKEASKEYNFNVTTLVTDTGNFWNFYATSEYASKLTVTPKNSDVAVLTIVLEESINPDTSSLLFTKTTNPQTTYRVVEWTTSDDLGQIAEDNLKWYQQFWNGIGEFFGRVDDRKTAAFECTVFYHLQKETLNEHVRSTAYINTSDSIPCDKQAKLALAVATCNGYRFLGWYTAPVGGTKVGDETGLYTVTDSVDLYAHWQPNKVVLQCNGGSVDGKEEYIPDDLPYIKLPVPKRSDYYFDGWYSKETGGERIDTGDGYFLVPIDNAIIWAHWLPAEELCRVKFMTGQDIYETVFLENDVIPLIPVENTSGKQFVGWVDENGNLYTDDITKEIIEQNGVNNELVLYKKWHEYVVTYDAKTNGGSCPTENDSGIVTLPLPSDRSNEGLQFLGWYTSASGDDNNKAGEAGETYTPDSDITLYACWRYYTVSFNSNNGSPASIDPVYGVVSSLPGVSRTYYDFDGWYTAIDGGEKITCPYVPKADVELYAHWKEWKFTLNFSNNGGTGSYDSKVLYMSNQEWSLSQDFGFSKTGYSIVNWNTKADGTGVSFNADEYFSVSKLISKGYTGTITDGFGITLYAQWKANSYNLNVSTNGATITVKVNGKSAEQGKKTYTVLFGDKVELSVNYSYSNEKTFIVDGQKVSGTSYAFDMPAHDVEVSASSSSCVIEGTMITMADGTRKPVEEVQAGDLLLVWNLRAGTYDVAPVVFNDSEPRTYCDVIHAVFSDGTDVGIVSEHGFFDIDLGQYVYIDLNGAQYIGDRFVKYSDGGKWEIVTLSDVVIETEYTACYSPVTFSYLCYYTNGMLSMPGGISGLFNIYEVDVDAMSYDSEAMMNDIGLYGQLSYEDFTDIIPEEMFYAFNGSDLGVAIGKGLLTWEDIERLAERYVPVVEEQNS